MKVRYFKDTDTILIEFSNREVAETIEVSEDLYVDVDKDGKIVSLTLEHASEQTDFSEISFSPGFVLEERFRANTA